MSNNSNSMLGYNILCAFAAIVVGFLCGSGLEMRGSDTHFIAMFAPLFYMLFFVGLLPSYWAFVRNLCEKIHLTIVNVVGVLGVVCTITAINNIPVIALSGFMMINLIILLLWLGLLMYSIWCGTEKN